MMKFNDNNKNEIIPNNNNNIKIINDNDSYNINNGNIENNISGNIEENININKINLEPIKEVEDDINSNIFFKINGINSTKNINININNNQIKDEKDKSIDFSSKSNSKQSFPYLSKNLTKHKLRIYSINSGNTGNSTNDSEYYSSLPSPNASERNSILDKNVQLIVDIKKIIF